MIYGGIPTDEVEPYLHKRAWLADAATILGRTNEDLAAELVDTMVSSGAIAVRGGRLQAAADHVPVGQETLRIPYPHAWPEIPDSRPGGTRANAADARTGRAV